MTKFLDALFIFTLLLLTHNLFISSVSINYKTKLIKAQSFLQTTQQLLGNFINKWVTIMWKM